MRRHYRLHELEDTEFEDLVARICMRILGLGSVVFAPGKDQGRDARFNGKAQKFPSETEPAKGKFVIQAKHTSNPYSSCSDTSFQRILDQEEPKLKVLIEEGELEYYLLFTNRYATGGAEKKIVQRLRKLLGIREAWLLADETIRQHLDMHPEVWTSMGFDKYEIPFRFSPEDVNQVVVAFHAFIKDGNNPFESASHFDFVPKERKNKVNGLSKRYYEYMQRDSLPHFTKIKTFLEDPRNEQLAEFYHDAADELKQKIISARHKFENFDDVLTHVHELIVSGNAKLLGKKRLVSTFLHYMYFNCDIGDHAETN